MAKLSIICVYNKRKEFIFNLERTLKEQVFTDFEVIEVENDGRYKSAASAFNEALEKAGGELVLIAPPDLLLYDAYCLEDIVKYCEEAGEFGVSGTAAVIRENGVQKIVSNSAKTQQHYAYGEIKEETCEAEILDSSMIVLSRALLDKGIRFRDYGETWQFYGEDICLQSKVAGLKVFYNPAQVVRLLPPKADMSYVNALMILKEKYGYSGEKLMTVMGNFGMSSGALALRKAACIPMTFFGILFGFLDKVR